MQARQDYKALAMLSIVAMLLALPVLWSGFPTLGHDAKHHMGWAGHFAQQFWAGEAYPRWLHGMNWGLGSPAFFYYPPLPYWVTALLQPLFPGEAGLWTAMAAAAALALLGSALLSYLWLRCIAPPPAAFVGALAYLLVPYHLTVDLLIRAAWAEYWAMTWLPLLLWAAHRLAQGRLAFALLLSAGTALLALSHLPSLVLFGPLPLAYALVVAEPGRRRRAATAIVVAMLLGLGLAAMYLLPALTMQGDIAVEHLWRGGYAYSEWFLRNRHVAWLLDMLVSGAYRDDPAMRFAFVLIVGMALSTACSALAVLFVWLGADDGVEARRRLRLAVFWLLVAAVSFWLITRTSLPVWRVLTPLQKVQFPWRFGTVNAVAFCAIVALCAASLQQARASLARAGAAVLLASAAVFAWMYWIGVGPVLRQPAALPLAQYSVDVPEYHPRWVSTPMAEVLAQLPQVDGAAVAALSSSGGEWQPLHWGGRRLALQIDAPADSLLTLRQLYFPGWEAEIDGMPAAVLPSQPHGLLTVAIPPGPRRVELWLRATPTEWIGHLLSAIALLLWCACAVALWRRARGARSRPAP